MDSNEYYLKECEKVIGFVREHRDEFDYLEFDIQGQRIEITATVGGTEDSFQYDYGEQTNLSEPCWEPITASVAIDVIFKGVYFFDENRKSTHQKLENLDDTLDQALAFFEERKEEIAA